MMKPLCFLKLGGSLITNKDQPRTPRLDVLERLATEICQAKNANPHLKLVIGHGSGSFGHMPAARYGTRKGVNTPQQWLGFAEVWQDARALNQLVIESLANAGLPVIALPPSASVLSSNGSIHRWNLSQIKAALKADLVPVIQGDVIFDTWLGGTILSTEELFFHLAQRLKPHRILLTGLETGVWADFPACTRVIERITPQNLPEVHAALGGSASVDVTGGMLKKVENMIDLVKEDNELKVLIFSGAQDGLTRQALLGNPAGTVVCAG